MFRDLPGAGALQPHSPQTNSPSVGTSQSPLLRGPHMSPTEGAKQEAGDKKSVGRPRPAFLGGV